MPARNHGDPVAVSLLNAVFCVDCETISNSPHDACAICGSRSLVNLFKMLGGTLRSPKAQTGARTAKYSVELTAKVHGIPAAELNHAIESITRLAEVGSQVESLHINVEPVYAIEALFKAA